MSSYAEGQVHQLVNALEKVGFTADDITKLGQFSELTKLLGVVRGDLMISEPSTIVRVGRSIRPTYPDWVKEVLHPELETAGPTEYNLAKVELWLHEGQKNGKWTTGNKIYEHLKATDSLKNCLNLQDAVEIQKLGIVNFRKLFGNKAIFCWKSVVRGSDGDLYVPCVFDYGGRVVVHWYYLGYSWYDGNPAARFAS